jgi:hypothetical protein
MAEVGKLPQVGSRDALMVCRLKMQREAPESPTSKAGALAEVQSRNCRRSMCQALGTKPEKGQGEVGDT